VYQDAGQQTASTTLTLFDINNLTASTGAQLIINFIGTLAHSGQIGR
jgi:hypothetical protein